MLDFLFWRSFTVAWQWYIFIPRDSEGCESRHKRYRCLCGSGKGHTRVALGLDGVAPRQKDRVPPCLLAKSIIGQTVLAPPVVFVHHEINKLGFWSNLSFSVKIDQSLYHGEQDSWPIWQLNQELGACDGLSNRRKVDWAFTFLRINYQWKWQCIFQTRVWLLTTVAFI